MAADHPGEQALVGEVVHAAAASIPLAGGVHHGQVPRAAAGQEAALQGQGELLGVGAAHEAAGGHGGPVRHQRRRLIGGEEAYFGHGA